MPDVYSTIADADTATQQWLAEVLELRAADPQQRAMLEGYTADLDLSGARVLEIGCGTGPISRFLATLPGVKEVVGVDPGELFIERARELAGDERLEFVVGDGGELAFADATFDAVVCHNTLCHVLECERVVAEAHRVLRPGGALAVFDGDYVTATVAIREDDPLQACMDAFVALLHDPWLMRRIGSMLREAGLGEPRLRGHSFIQTTEADYLVTLVEHGANVLARDGALSETEAEALKAEARMRVEDGTFFGHIAYVSAIARRA